jgi:conjugal transfer ATP-binding protein TraC
MRDLVELLESGAAGADKTNLADRLKRFTSGTLSGLFSGPTTLRLDSPLVLFDTHDCETDLFKVLTLFLVSNYVWSQAFQGTIPRQLIVDEAASLVQYPSGKSFLEDLVRRARKNYLGVTTITQHPSTFANSTLIANSAIKVLMRPDPTSLDLIKELFKLSDREAQRIQRLRIGEGLMLVADQRLIVQFITSDLEHILATTNPREIAEWMEKPDHAHLRALLQRLSSDTSSLLELAGMRRE